MPPRCFLLRVLPRARAWDKSAFFRLDDGPFLFFERAFGTRRTRCENGDFKKEYIYKCITEKEKNVTRKRAREEEQSVPSFREREKNAK